MSPTRPLCPSELSRPDLSPFLPSMLHCGCTLAPTDSFGGSVEETESSAPGGSAGDLLGGETLQLLQTFFHLARFSWSVQKWSAGREMAQEFYAD